MEEDEASPPPPRARPKERAPPRQRAPAGRAPAAASPDSAAAAAAAAGDLRRACGAARAANKELFVRRPLDEPPREQELCAGPGGFHHRSLAAGFHSLGDYPSVEAWVQVGPRLQACGVPRPPNLDLEAAA